MSLVKKVTSRETFVQELKNRLTQEFKEPSPGFVEPLISIERQNHGRDHIIVVWQEWEELTTWERSEVIMDAYEQALGMDAALNVTFAYGLTELESKRKGFIFQPLNAASPKEAAIA